MTTEAMANDDELAASIPEQDSNDTGPRISEYTAEVARLDVLSDLIRELIAVTVQLSGNKAPRVKPARRPETAFTRAANRRRDNRLGALIAEVEEAQSRWDELHKAE